VLPFLDIILKEEFSYKLIAYFPFIRHGPHRKRCLHQFLVTAGMCLQSRCLAPNIQTCQQSLLLYDMDRKENEASTILLLLRVFVATRTFLPTRCLATIEAIYMHIDWLGGGEIFEVRRWDGLRCQDTVYVHTKFHKEWFRHSKVHKGHTQTQRQHGDRISLFLFFQNKDRGAKN
jgi:hypothetical protein